MVFAGFGCGGIRVLGDDDDIAIARFEALEFTKRILKGAERGIDAILDALEILVAKAEGLGSGLDVSRASAAELVPEGALRIGEAAKLPLTEDDLVEKAA